MNDVLKELLFKVLTEKTADDAAINCLIYKYPENNYIVDENDRVFRINWDALLDNNKSGFTKPYIYDPNINRSSKIIPGRKRISISIGRMSEYYFDLTEEEETKAWLLILEQFEKINQNKFKALTEYLNK